MSPPKAVFDVRVFLRLPTSFFFSISQVGTIDYWNNDTAVGIEDAYMAKVQLPYLIPSVWPDA